VRLGLYRRRTAITLIEYNGLFPAFHCHAATHSRDTSRSLSNHIKTCMHCRLHILKQQTLQCTPNKLYFPGQITAEALIPGRFKRGHRLFVFGFFHPINRLGGTPSVLASLTCIFDHRPMIESICPPQIGGKGGAPPRSSFVTLNGNNDV
jgi:hypothetical protein